MGLTSSTSDHYVLRYEDTTPNNTLEHNRPAKYPRKASKVHPTNTPLPHANHGPTAPLSPPGERLIKSKSQIVLPNTDKYNNLRNNLITRPSMPNILIPLKAPDKGMKYSEKYNWLIKNGDLNNYTLNDFEFGKVIGKGLMGTVRVCKITKKNKYFVLKSIRKDYIEKHHDHRHIRNERLVLSTLTSLFCTRYFGNFQDRYYIHFALEYCPGGELFHRLGRKKFFIPSVAKFYATEIFSALDHMHSLNFMYRDLKPENVILDEEGHCKLVDFGFSRPCNDDDRIHTLCGTPAYLSPEQLDGKLTNGYTRVVDWWSFGVLLYELLTGKTPFSNRTGESHYEIFLRILKSKIWFPLSFDSKSKELICALCHANVEKRLCDPGLIKVNAYFEMPWDMVEQRKLVPPFIPKLKDEGDHHYFKTYHDNGFPPNYKSDNDKDNYQPDQLFFDF
mmetsp:Transcript_17796/g.19285  ORF Transcript_17796/g.19285 Transcript_17796/m.19285 type:complete len:447 (+) Transcript_17796:341-1681(+)